VHAHALAHLLSLATRYASVHYYQVTTAVGADVNSAMMLFLAMVLMAVFMMMFMVVFMMISLSVNTNATNALVVGGTSYVNGNIMPTGQQMEGSVRPVALHLSVVGVAAITRALIEDWVTGLSDQDSIVINGETVAGAVQVSNVHNAMAVQVEHDGSHAANSTKGKVHPSTINWQVSNGPLNLIN